MTHVLLVEDNPALLDSISLELEMRGYSVATATDGRSALDVLNGMGRVPDIIVSDIAMPDMDGYAFLQAVHANQEWGSIPFIFLTALGSDKEIRYGKTLGVDDYLVKPFQPDDLIVAMENKLQRVATFRQQAQQEVEIARNELINLISHELNTPLTAIYTGTEMLASDLEQVSDEMTLQMLQVIRRGTQRMRRLIAQIIQLVQIDSGQLDREIQQFSSPQDLYELLVVAIQRVKRDFEHKSVEVQLDSSQALVIPGMADALVAVFYEAIRNAYTFSPEDEKVLVETMLTNDDMAQITVTDYGQGIRVEDQAGVWERFIQSDRASLEQQGAGLGLSIVRDIVMRHGGRVSLISQPNEGTQLMIRLPIA